MKFTTLGIDLAKSIFQLHGVDARGVIGPECNPPAARQRSLQHRPGTFALGVAVGRFDRELDPETVAVLTQRIGRVTQLSFLA